MEGNKFAVAATPFWPLVFLLGDEARYLLNYAYPGCLRRMVPGLSRALAVKEASRQQQDPPPLNLSRRKALRLYNKKETPRSVFKNDN